MRIRFAGMTSRGLYAISYHSKKLRDEWFHREMQILRLGRRVRQAKFGPDAGRAVLAREDSVDGTMNHSLRRQRRRAPALEMAGRPHALHEVALPKLKDEQLPKERRVVAASRVMFPKEALDFASAKIPAL